MHCMEKRNILYHEIMVETCEGSICICHSLAGGNSFKLLSSSCNIIIRRTISERNVCLWKWLHKYVTLVANHHYHCTVLESLWPLRFSISSLNFYGPLMP